jgi:imidazolonepropionase-like amidohydrolase
MTPYGEWHTREMELFVELLGFSNFDALLSMTKVASLAIPRFGHLIGTLSQGKYADLVVVDGRPDEDVKLLGRKKNLFAVMKGGKLIDISHEELARETYLFERTRLYTNGKFRRNDSQ